MSEDKPIQRRSLVPSSRPLAGIRSVDAQQPAGDNSGAAAVAEKHGFDRVPVPASELQRLEANQVKEPPRRKRGAGRTMPFTTRLAPETFEYIYEVANTRDIPLAQVIEEMADAHKKRGA